MSCPRLMKALAMLQALQNTSPRGKSYRILSTTHEEYLYQNDKVESEFRSS